MNFTIDLIRVKAVGPSDWLYLLQIIPINHRRHKHVRFIHHIAEILPDD